MATVQIATAKDCWIYSTEPTNNFGAASNIVMRVGEDNALTGAVGRGLLWFVLSSIPAGSVINSVTLNIYENDENASNARLMHVYRVIRNWELTQTTWNIAKTGTNWGTAGCANTTTDFVNTSLGSRSFSATEAAGWKQITLDASAISQIVNGAVTYEGFVLRMATETDDQHRFASSRNASGNAAYLEIDYTPPGPQFQVVMI